LAATPQPPRPTGSTWRTRTTTPASVYHSTDRPELARKHWQESRSIRQALAREFPSTALRGRLGRNALAMGV